jgi:hypothetical protein
MSKEGLQKVAKRRNKLPKKKSIRDKNLFEQSVIEQDENFYFIVGYTENGFPYGITWEEHEAESCMDESVQSPLTRKEEDYYYISSYSKSGEIIGVTWEEFLWTLKDEETYTTYTDSQQSDEQDYQKLLGSTSE